MRPSNRLWLCFVLACSGLCAAEPRLLVTYEAARRELAAADLAALPAVEVTALDHGQSHRYRGIAVRDVLALVDAPLGEKHRGSAAALAVRVRAADGYVVAFALAEFDAAFREQTILLVETQDGAPLPENAGPLRLVCPGDKRGARWVRQVTSLEVISLATPPPARP